MLKPPAFSAIGGEAANDGDADDGDAGIVPPDVPDPLASDGGEPSGISPPLTRTLSDDVTGCAT
jgi:hypothetical protein